MLHLIVLYISTTINKLFANGLSVCLVKLLNITLPCITLMCRLFPVPWWGYHLGQHDGSWWLTTLDPAVLHSMPSRQRLGVLNAAHDLVKHLGHKLKPFLPEMCALVLVLLQGSSLNSNQVQLVCFLCCFCLRPAAV